MQITERVNKPEEPLRDLKHPIKEENTDLTEERLQVAGLQLELLKDGWCCAVEMLKKTVVVALRDVSLRQIKHVHQRQDVTVRRYNTVRSHYHSNIWSQ